MKNESTQPEIEAHIRKLIDQQIRAVRDKNIDEALSNFDKDVLSFDVVDPLQFKGIDAIRKRLEEWFSTFQGTIENEISDLKIEISGNVAFCSRLNHVNAVRVDGGKLDMWWRETTCFKEMDGRWMITHVHSSVPFNTQNGKASISLKPSAILEDIAIKYSEEKEVSLLIKKYNKINDEAKLMKMIKEEDGWDYANENIAYKYKMALETSITYVAYQGDVLCGYSRSIDDCGFYIYVCDLLVIPVFRGKGIGRKLMECIYQDYPNRIVYVMSDVDGYYEKVDFKRIGSIFEVPKKV